MEKQLQVHCERPVDGFQERRIEEASKEVSEEQFLKELYLFMRKRDTPIERIPHLGFKQIDLFVMFKTVNNLGGYQQVTSQQLWKQVYNTLGGNPRSTSAATCTRRHYEKLLLPFECHKKGIVMSVVPQHPMKPFHYITYDKVDDCGPRPAKRKMLPLPLHQSHLSLHSDPHRSLFPLPLHYPHYFPAGHVVLPPHVPLPPAVMAPHASPLPMPRFPPLPPPHVVAAPDRGAAEPLEHLRSLSEWYKTSSGLVQQPLNLSTKAAPARELASAPVSSFSPPSTSKNPKFLNKPSTLYPSLRAEPPRSEGSDTQEEESSEGGAGGANGSYLRREPDGFGRARESSSPGYAATSGTDDDIVEVTGKPSSPATDSAARTKEEREVGGGGGGEPRGLNLSQAAPRPKEGDVEIEIPLSVFHNWLKLYRSSAMAHRMREAPPSAEEARAAQRRWLDADALARNLTFQLRPPGEDARPRNAPSPPTAVHGLPGFLAPPPGGALKRAASAYPFDPTDVERPFRSQSFWGGRAERSPPRALPDFASSSSSSSKSCADDVAPACRQRAEAGPPPAGALAASSNALLQLTTEEIVKLKKMISSSS